MTNTIAKPHEIAIAWEAGVMRGNPRRAKDELNQHRTTVDDPIYHRDQYSENGGWARAEGISNPSAMRDLTAYLAEQGLRVPDHVQAAWDETLRRQEARLRVLKEVESELSMTDENHERPEAEDYAADVARRLNDAFGLEA